MRAILLENLWLKWVILLWLVLITTSCQGDEAAISPPSVVSVSVANSQTPTGTPRPMATPLPTLTPTPTSTPTPIPSPTPTPTVAITPVADQALLSPMSHEYQKFNNCGPAALAMTLSYYGFELSQFDVAPMVKGNDEDKNVSPEEMAAYLAKMGLASKVRTNGRIETMLAFVSNGIPVIVQQWLVRPHDGELVGHYRVVRGYDQRARTIIVNDPYRGPEVTFSFELFDERWQPFNRHYIPVYPAQREAEVEAILGEDYDDEAMQRRALAAALAEVEEDPGNAYVWFNLGDDYLALGQYKEAIEAYDRAMALGLPPLFLWYQHGPAMALNQAGEYQRTLDLTAQILARAPGIEELYKYRGDAYLGLGRTKEAVAEYQLALRYNPNYLPAREALQALGQS